LDNMSRMSRRSDRGGGYGSKRPLTASSAGSSRPLTGHSTRRSGSVYSEFTRSRGHGGNASDREGQYRPPHASRLVVELPPLIKGLSLNEARDEFHRLFPPPTMTSLFFASDASGVLTQDREKSENQRNSGGSQTPLTSSSGALGRRSNLSSGKGSRSLVTAQSPVGTSRPFTSG